MIEEIKSEVEDTEHEDTEQEEDQTLDQEEGTLIVDEEEVDEVEVLKEEIAALQQQSEEYLDGWQRERAEFANYKKRTERERQQMRLDISGTIIRRYLEIVDDLERALQNKPTEGEGATWAEGIELVYRKFLTALEAEGVVLMEAANQEFDPNLHEAISQEPNEDFESGHVIEVVRNGYMIGERVLRPATVRVAQ
ncbi:MAG: nucleotide exchange factor GrpE [Anaerolineales bacterium]